mgnify:CR=1
MDRARNRTLIREAGLEAALACSIDALCVDTVFILPLTWAIVVSLAFVFWAVVAVVTVESLVASIVSAVADAEDFED